MAVAKKIQVYDTTLRDGCQSEDVSLTVEDKLEIAERLDDLGIDYIEGGWPGSNERDAAFFIAPLGAGKGAAALTALAELIRDGERRHALVIAPKLVAATVWPREVTLWPHLAHLRVAVLNGTPKRRRELLADGIPVELGTRAFDALLVLLEADGSLVTKDELLNRVWPDIVVSEENLKVQVAALRKALGADRDIIRTEFGRGYRFTGVLRSNALAALPERPMRAKSRSVRIVFPQYCCRQSLRCSFSDATDEVRT